MHKVYGQKLFNMHNKAALPHKLLARFTLAKVGGKQYTKHVLRGKARHRRNE